MATIVIIGASRGIGLETVKAGLAAGHQVRALARSAASIPIDDPQLQKITGSALSREVVETALEGADAVLQTIGVTSPRELMFGTTLFSNSTRILIDVMEAAGPKRLIAVTGIGAGNSRGRTGAVYDYLLFPLLLQRIYADKDVAEDMISKSTLQWTIVRPGGLTSGAATGRYRVLPDMKDWRFGFISRADVADFLIKQVDDLALVHKTPLLIS